jgi:hypothetical protein
VKKYPQIHTCKSINSTAPWLSLIGAAGIMACGTESFAASFPAKGDDLSSTMAVFRVAVSPNFVNLMDTDSNPSTFTSYPGYDQTTMRLTSPLLLDPNTIIGHSDPAVHPIGTVQVGTANTLIGPSDYVSIPAIFQSPPAGTREVRTEVRDLYLVTGGQCYRDTTHGVPLIAAGLEMVKGGTAEGLALCPGLVQANQLSSDFNAKSMFEVYVQVDLPAVGTFPGASLYNSDPLLVENDSIDGFPPHVVYLHEETTAVRLKFKTTNPGKWNHDDVFGFLVLAGHATQIGCDSNSTTQITAFLDKVLGTTNNPVVEPPLPNVKGNGNGTGTPVSCCGVKPTFAQAGSANSYLTFNGQIAAVTCLPANPTTGQYNPAGYSLGIADLQNPTPPINVNYNAPMYHGPGNAWTGGQLGTIFGVCFDNSGNIYVTPTSCYNTDVAGFSGSFGSVYKIDGVSGLVSVFANLPNTGAALGNIKYSCQHANFYVSNMDDGKIYRLSPTGAILSTWDHGANLPTATPPSAAILDNPSAQFTQLGRRVWGLNVANGRLYYAIWWEDQGRQDPVHSNEIWSIALAPNGQFIAGTDFLEITMPPRPGAQYSNPVSDISFGPTGTMLLAERTMAADSSPGAHDSRLLEYVFTGTWTPSPNTFAVSMAYPPGSDAGGCGYDFSAGGRVWTTADYIHGGFNDYIYGLQGLPATGGSILNSVLIDLDNNTTSTSVKTEIGDVELPCVSSGCLFITNEVIDCVGTNGTFVYTFCATNQFNGPISYFSLLDPPPGVTFTPDVIALNTVLQPGQGACQTVTVSFSGTGPTNICFRIGAHTTNFVQCCATPHCITLPKCCANITQEATVPIAGSANCYNYTFTLNNVTVPPVPIQYIVLVPDPPSCFSFSPDIVYLSTPLLPGQSITKTVKVCANPPCKGPFCFTVSIHDTNFVACCAFHHCLPPIKPGIAVGNPNDGSTFVAPTNITLGAVVDPTIGVVAVNYAANNGSNTTVVASSTNAPFSAVWSNAPPGQYSLTANGADQSGGVWISDPITILVFGGPPSPGAPPRLMSARIQDGSISFSVSTVPGVTYTIECSESLTVPNWRVLQIMIGDGSTMSFSDPLQNAPQRFYRIRAN